MIVTNNIRLGRFFLITWKTDLLLLITCFLAYNAEKYFFANYFSIPPLIPTVIGAALAFFIGFNNNQAYDRWWEARKVWGALVNDSRSWARSILYFYNVEIGDTNFNQHLKEKMIKRHLAFVYSLRSTLRNSNDEYFKKFLNADDLVFLRNESNKANALLNLQAKDLQISYKLGLIDGFRFLELNKLLIAFCDEMGQSERIKNTVFPTTYHYFTKLFIWVFGLLVSFCAAQSTGIWSILFALIVGFVFHTSHIIGMALVNPFEPVATSISLDAISRTIEINLLEMLGEEKEKIPEPVKPIDGEFLM